MPFQLVRSILLGLSATIRIPAFHYLSYSGFEANLHQGGEPP